jgi:RNA polymerase sigma-70 factor (ECF subfamily)
VADPRPADAELVEALRGGDEAAFSRLVSEWSPSMLRIARTYVGTWAAAEDVVQDTWMAVVRGLPQFAHRSSLRTWVLTILGNRARSRATREVVWAELPPDLDAAVDPGRFRDDSDPFPGGWRPGGVPVPWREHPESSAVSREAMAVLQEALTALPERQQLVVRLRDVHDLSAGEVCEVLGISAENQRVLLHRGRSRLRAELERQYADGRV